MLWFGTFVDKIHYAAVCYAGIGRKSNLTRAAVAVAFGGTEVGNLAPEVAQSVAVLLGVGESAVAGEGAAADALRARGRMMSTCGRGG